MASKQGPPKHQNRYAWDPNANRKKNETEVGGKLRPYSQITGVCPRCKEQIDWKRKYGKYKPLTEPAKCQRCSKRNVRQAYHNLCSGCAKEHQVCAKCSCRVERIVGRDCSEVEAEQKTLEEVGFDYAIKNARERERRTLLRTMNKGKSDGSSKIQTTEETKVGELVPATSLEESAELSGDDDDEEEEDNDEDEEQILEDEKIKHKNASNMSFNIVLKLLLVQISHLQTQLGVLLEQLHTNSPESKAVAKFSEQVLGIAISLDKLADSLSSLYSNAPAAEHGMSNVDEDFSDPEESDAEERSLSGKVFNSGELHNYTSPKPNRLNGKKNFLGVEAVYPSIGLPCAGMASNLDRFMTYETHGTCPDDLDMAQKLMAGGCEPLPRRRCFSRSPPHYSRPLSINNSLWTQPSGVNILWNHYKCKDYSCLVSKETTDRRGFFKCADCFDLLKRGWEIPTNESVSAEFTIDEVLWLKPGEIRIGLDFSPTTGTFAAIMRERNVTIASATLNLGAPFNEVIALRGLLPLYISIGSRLPFFDNTLDIVHSTLFLDGWIGMKFLQFVLFDWDRVLRPKGLLWVDRFFCKKEDMKLYLDEFTKMGYRKLLWRVVPKTDKLGDELFFSAVLEKPIRG
ncbi:hypothetical protein L1049_003370 [Liquidambar formosana]|uniref:S-adenosyl-L-methionine-dependent methyltransferase superfamily protein n=1 Tax=Liquidambar formosana TaxID=63359 RepID=A0AAP0NMK9_LIQFO